MPTFWANQWGKGWPTAVQQSGDGWWWFMMVHHIAMRNPTSLKMRSTSGENVLNWITCPVPDSFATGYEQLIFRYDLINEFQMLFHQNAQPKQTNNLSTKHGQGLLAYSYRKSKHQYNSIHLILVLVIEMKRVLGYLISKKKNPWLVTGSQPTHKHTTQVWSCQSIASNHWPSPLGTPWEARFVLGPCNPSFLLAPIPETSMAGLAIRI